VRRSSRIQRRRTSYIALPEQGALEFESRLYLTLNRFTTKRLALLKLMASQAAISLDHARLYSDLVQENNDRGKAKKRCVRVRSGGASWLRTQPPALR
jgi:GAF domain-containing protein